MPEGEFWYVPDDDGSTPVDLERDARVVEGLARLREDVDKVKAEREAEQRKALDHLLAVTPVGVWYQDDKTPTFISSKTRDILVDVLIKDGWRRG